MGGARLRLRAAVGGHAVSEHKIRQRYQRLWELVAAAIVQSDTATVYDNSVFRGPSIAAQLSAGHTVGVSAWPV